MAAGKCKARCGIFPPIGLKAPLTLSCEQGAGMFQPLHPLQPHREAFVPRRALESIEDISDYDHLSRFAEWIMHDVPAAAGE